MSISGNMVGSYSQIGKTFILVDESGAEITGVCVDNPVIFTAGDNDVRENMVYAGDSGVSTGTKNIPAYRTTQSTRAILPGKDFSISLSPYDLYNYTKFQCVISRYNTNINNSVFTDKISINDKVYPVNSLEPLANITKNSTLKSIDLNIINDTSYTYIVNFFTYKEEE